MFPAQICLLNPVLYFYFLTIFINMKLYRIVLVLFLVNLIFSCGSDNDNAEESMLPQELVEAKGEKFYGKTLKVNSVERFTSLFPSTLTDIYSQHISSQIYEGLLKFNPSDLSIEPCIAESYQIDSANRTYIFSLRDNVFFHDSPCFKKGKGRKLTAKDVKFTFEFLCSDHELNTSPILWRNYIKGANAYFEKTADHVSGIKVMDDYTIKLELNESFSGFLNIIALSQTSIFPEEALTYYNEKLINEVAVGTGPYKVKEIGEKVVLEKNNHYWKKDTFGNQLPFISFIEIQFKDDKSQELTDFKNGDLDFVWGLPVEEIQNVMGSLQDARAGKNKEFTVQSINNLSVEYYGFLLTDSLFKNKNLRKALNYALNRPFLASYILNGSALPASSGIVPHMKDYPSEIVSGYEYSPRLAKEYLRKAGYRSGQDVPPLNLHYNKSGQVNELVANEIKKQIFTTLGIEVNLIDRDRQELIEKIEQGQLPFWRYGWIADYPDPANFIMQFHSKNIGSSVNNTDNLSKFSNPDFDNYFDKAMAEDNLEKRMELLAKAEHILINDAAVIPLFYQTSIRLINPEVVNFPINELEFRDYSKAYFIKRKKVRVYDNVENIELE